MKTHILHILTSLALSAAALEAHEGVELGPNDGRIFELSSKTTPHLEVGHKDGKFVIHVLDENEKQVPIGDRTLSIIAGERTAPQQLKIEKTADQFTAPIPKGEKFPVVIQLREKEGEKPLLARMNYDASTCSECKRSEWLCTCGGEEEEQAKK